MSRPVLMVGFILLIRTAMTTSPATAGSPDPGTSVVPNVVYDPQGMLTYVVTVLDASSVPCAGIPVDIVFSPAADALTCWCPGQTHPTISGTTDSDGKASFVIHAGGCIDPAFVGAGNGIDVFADGNLLASVGGVSPDVVDDAGILPWDGWDPAGVCITGLADAVYHTYSIRIRLDDFCSDLNSSGGINLVDLILLTPSVKFASFCEQ